MESVYSGVKSTTKPVICNLTVKWQREINSQANDLYFCNQFFFLEFVTSVAYSDRWRLVLFGDVRQQEQKYVLWFGDTMKILRTRWFTLRVWNYCYYLSLQHCLSCQYYLTSSWARPSV